MEGERFDRIVVAWSALPSRRRLLRGLAATGLGATLVRLGLAPEGAAACRPPGKKCERKGQCCSNICKRRCRCNDGRKACRGSCCSEGAECRNGQCLGQCAAGEDFCTGFSACSNEVACRCATKMADSTTACGKLPPGICTLCASDGDCATFGTDAFCVKKTGTSCCTNIATNQGFCYLPCPT